MDKSQFRAYIEVPFQLDEIAAATYLRDIIHEAICNCGPKTGDVGVVVQVITKDELSVS